MQSMPSQKHAGWPWIIAMACSANAHIQCTRNNTLIIHGCNTLEHANDTLVHYNNYRSAWKQQKVACDTHSEIVVDVNSSMPIVITERCIAHIAKVAAWKQPTTTTPPTITITTQKELARAQQRSPATSSSSSSSSQDSQSQSKRKSETAMIVAIVVIALAALMPVAWIVKQKMKSEENVAENDMVVAMDQNPIYEIPTNVVPEGPLYDNINIRGNDPIDLHII